MQLLDSMAAVPRLWESAVKVLEDLSDSGSGDAGCSTSTHTGQVEAPLAEAWRRIQRAHEGRVLPEATWKAMIRDKVRQRVLTTLANKAQQTPFNAVKACCDTLDTWGLANHHWESFIHHLALDFHVAIA